MYNYILADCGLRRLRKSYKDLYTVETVESSSQHLVKRGDFECDSSLKGTESKCNKNGLELYTCIKQMLLSSFMCLIYSCKRYYV